MDDCVYPNESVYHEQLIDSGNPHHHPAVMEEMKAEARKRGLWNLFQPHKEWGPGLSNLEYAPLAEIMGRSSIASEACNCSAPDTGNMEVLTMFGTPRAEGHVADARCWRATIRSAFAMTEPDVASSDATNIAMRIERDGDDYVLNGRKWWITGAMHPQLQGLHRDGQDRPVGSSASPAEPDPGADGHARADRRAGRCRCSATSIRRAMSNCEFEDLRVPASNLIATTATVSPSVRLGWGPVASTTACDRSVRPSVRSSCCASGRLSRTTFGKRVAERSNIMDWIAESRIDLEMVRLLTLKTAWMMDNVGNKAAAVEISAIKVAAPERRAADHRSGHAGPRRRWSQRRLGRWHRCTRTSARCASPTDPTRCTR